MRPFQLLLLLIFFAACSNQDTVKSVPVLKTYDTLSNGLEIINRTLDSPYYYKDQVSTVSLQGGLQVYYAQDDSSYYLYLKKQDTLTLLNKTDQFSSLHSLGNVTADEKSYFVLGHDNGNSTPYSYEFIDKKTRKNPLGYGVRFLDYRELNGILYLLYADTITNGRERLILFNTNDKKKEVYELQNKYWILYIDTLTNKELTVKFTLDRDGDTTKIKTYGR